MANDYILIMYPNVIYPLALDSDYTLFQTYNSTQGVLATVLDEFSVTVDIISPKDTNWPENGFITLSGELIYYDAIERIGNIKKLIRCVRGVEGGIKEHSAGTNVYGNVIAQHHNQLANAILRLEAIVGTLQGDLQEVNTIPIPTKFGQFAEAQVDLAFSNSLGATLGKMLSYGTNWNDACPDVDFVYNIIDTDDGQMAEYCVKIYGDYTTYLLDFGDGDTTTDFAGTHPYTGGNPRVSVTSDSCTVIMEPLTPSGECTPVEVSPTPYSFYIPMPSAIVFPSFTVPKLTCPGPLFSFPPIGGGNSVDMSSICNCFPSVFSIIMSGILPSIISIEGCCPPSMISYVGCCPPSFISFTGVVQPSVISFVNNPELPSVISFIGGPPSAISLVGCQTISLIAEPLTLTTSCISFCEPPIFAPISFTEPPVISIDWGTPPKLSVVVTCGASTTPATPFMATDFQNNLGMTAEMPVDIGIPEEIRLIVPNIPDVHLVHDVPKSIKVESNIPKSILVEPASNFPSSIRLEMETLQVTGIPKSIELIAPSFIQLVMPENPVVKMVYDGPALQLTLSPEAEKLLKNLAIVSK